MKKVIRGRKHDTETAREIGAWESILDVSDFNHYCETLYLKRNGEYLIYGIGGPASKYATSEGNNSWSGGSAFIPMNYEAAREWILYKYLHNDHSRLWGLTYAHAASGSRPRLRGTDHAGWRYQP